MATRWQYFVILSFSLACTGDDIIFTCETDNPCHAVIWVGTKPPLTKPWPHKKRGIVQVHDRLVSFGFNLGYFWQAEPNDTTTHTFTIPLTTYDIEVWWYMTAYREGAPMISRSQFFHHKCVAPTYANACQLLGTRVGGDMITTSWRQSHPFKPTKTYQFDTISVWIARWNPTLPPPPILEITLWYTDAAGKPIGTPLLTLDTPILLPPYPQIAKITVQTPLTQLTLNQNYALVQGGMPLYPPNPVRWFQRVWNTIDTCTGAKKGYHQQYSASGWEAWVQQNNNDESTYDIPERTS